MHSNLMHNRPMHNCLPCRSSDLLALPTCDPDKVFAVQIAHEEGMVGGSVAYVQSALLYTDSHGERRIRWAHGVLHGN